MLTFSQMRQNFAAWASVLALGLAAAGCSKTGEPDEPVPAPSASVAATAHAAGPPGPWAPANGVRFSLAPEAGSVKSIVSRELSQAQNDGRRILVYVGATWCEPCQRFHRAAEAGALDEKLGKLTLVQFDLDRDRDRLRAAGYVSDFIPLFTLPAADGTATPHHMEGSIKGDGAVAQIVPRLQALLAQD
jgi:thiol-disulfide isomerase/thioredoxin